MKTLTQEDVAERLGITQATYASYEKEAANLTFKTLCKIALALECSLPFLIDVESNIYLEKNWKFRKVFE